MSILHRIKNLILADRISHWSVEDRGALIRLLYSACAADEAYSQSEQSFLQQTMRDVGIAWDEIQQIELKEAAQRLCSDGEKEEQLYRLLADALFADGDYDHAEKSFVSRLCSEEGLSRPKLEAEIKRARGQILDGALSTWNQQIESGDARAARSAQSDGDPQT